MTDLFSTALTALLVLVNLASALQVTPNSPCASLCLNDGDFNPANGSPFSTKSTEIACKDSAYSKLVGQKFRKCQECLQKSDFGSEEENDQEWFIYNLRFASDWCLYAPDNTEKPTGPCMDSATCAILERSLNITSEEPKKGAVFDYCDASGGGFGGKAVICNSCLQHMADYQFLSNWIVALQAGCSQRPSHKAVLSLDGSVFESRAIIATALQAPDTQQSNETSGDLSLGAMVGIIVSVVITVLVIAAFIGWQCHKRRKVSRFRGLRSKCHPRFGATDITAPAEGSYSEYKPEPIVEVLPWDAAHFQLKDVRSETSMSGRSNISSNFSAILHNAPNPELMNLAPAPQRSESQASGAISINPLRMNCYTKPRAATPPTLAVDTTDKVHNPALTASTAPTSAVQTIQSDSVRPSSTTPHPLTTENLANYDPSAHPPARYASSVISATSTTFSTGVYPPPTPFTTHSRPMSTISVATSRGNFPVAPLPAYNPANYAPKAKPKTASSYTPKPTNPYHAAALSRSQQQQVQQQFAGPLLQAQQQKRRPPTLNFHRPTLSQASARYTPFPTTTQDQLQNQQQQPQPSQPTQPSQRINGGSPSQSSTRHQQSSILKQSASSVPVISIPIPAPKRQTIDMRSFVGLGINTHIKPAPDPMPFSVPVSAVSAARSEKGQAQQQHQQQRQSPQLTPEELQSGLDRTNSLIRQSSNAFRELAEGMGIKRMTARPDDLHRDLDLERGGESAGAEARSSSVARSISRGSFRSRSASRPKRESMREESRERGRTGRDRSESRKGERMQSKLGFRFEFRGQDTVTEASPQSGSTQQSIEQWPGTGVICDPRTGRS